jgi:hypothetical protein
MNPEILTSKLSHPGMKITHLYNFSGSTFVIVKVTKEIVEFCNLDTGQAHQQTIEAYKNTKFVPL